MIERNCQGPPELPWEVPNENTPKTTKHSVPRRIALVACALAHYTHIAWFGPKMTHLAPLNALKKPRASQLYEENQNIQSKDRTRQKY